MATQAQQQTPDGRTHESRTAKVIELVCSSTTSFGDAIRNGLRDAAQTIDNISGAEVRNFNVHCQNGEVTEYRVDMRIAFGVDRGR